MKNLAIERSAIQINSKSDIFGKVFRMSAKDKYDSYYFVHKVMTYKKLRDRIVLDECFEWADEMVLYYNITHNFGEFKRGEVIDKYILWFAGYLYKYWMITRNTEPSEIYKILPLKRLEASFGFYHTQDWDKVIDEAIGLYNSKNYIV